MGLMLDFLASSDANTNITGIDTDVIINLRRYFSYMQWFMFFSAFFFVFVSYFNAPASWSNAAKLRYINVMPKIFFVFYILLDCTSIPLT